MQSPCSRPSQDCIRRSNRTLTIGLLNNMPDSALDATERQFASLLDAASGDIPIRVLLFALPGIPRGASMAGHMARYSSTHEMMSTPLDALIVTGREPLNQRLQDEPWWEDFTRVVDWARDHTISTVWSCLAAHAAVLYMDRIERIRSDRKHCGVFDCARVADHPLAANTGTSFRLPHSRWNGLNERELTRNGYCILTRSILAGVDTFFREDNSLFVFFQGHPEYEADTLLLEYRRDVARYFRAESARYPNLPFNYFDSEVATTLDELRRKALLFRSEELLQEVSAVLSHANVQRDWETTAAALYKGWLDHLWAEKHLRLSAKSPQTGTPELEGARLIPASAMLTAEYQPARTAFTDSASIFTIS
jgi:homoserine O-succinyltransferase/O-acetyltransferase